MTSKLTKVPISELPLLPTSHILTHNLTPDPNEPTPSAFIHDVLQNRPSIQRRARLLPNEVHFAYVSPLPLEFPYEVPPIPPTDGVDKAAYIENWLRKARGYHSSPGRTRPQRSHPQRAYQVRLTGARPDTDAHRALPNLSAGCLPHLDVGDAFDVLGRPVFVT